MPKFMDTIQAYVELGANPKISKVPLDTKIKQKPSRVDLEANPIIPTAFGYPEERLVRQDPFQPTKKVIVAHSQYGEDGKLLTGHPDLIQESNNYIDNLVAAANFKTKNGKSIRHAKLAKHFKTLIQNAVHEQEAKADLFSDRATSQNKTFLKHFAKVEETLQNFSQALEKVSGLSLKALEEAGHELRSKDRPTLIHFFNAPGTDSKQFILYMPCNRYTSRQKELLGNDIGDFDYTTSHNKDWLGCRSMVRMVVGTYDEKKKEKITIVHDSFSGPGARMPYSKFKQANSYTKLAIKAATLINQEEIIQTLAQREIDRMSDEELLRGIPKEKRGSYFSRSDLIKEYLQYNSIPVIECYTQVISAGQKINSQHQKEQFEYTSEMMNAFHGAKVKVNLLVDGKNIEAKVNYQARMGSFGVNSFRHAGFFNPCSDNKVTRKQNTRFINAITDDLYGFLHKGSMPKPMLDYLEGLNGTSISTDIYNKEAALKKTRKNYRTLLFEYYKAYHDPFRQNELWGYKKKIEDIKEAINKQETHIDSLHSQLEDLRKISYRSRRRHVQGILNDLKDNILQGGEQNKEKNKKIYNVFAYFVKIQELYYENTWYYEANNFKLQALVSCLAEKLGHANTKGCKSNNDRGQRLAEKIMGNELYTHLYDAGLYTGDFLKNQRTIYDAGLYTGDFLTNQNTLTEEKRLNVKGVDRELTTIPAIKHVEEQLVGGGKYPINKNFFADNGLFGKIAGLACVKDMGPKPAFNWPLRIIASTLAAAILTWVFPPAGISLYLVFGVTFAVTMLILTAFNVILNQVQKSKINRTIEDADHILLDHAAVPS